ncbi:leucine--tRNA ligase [Pseudoflavitalea sp. X16]|uniref:leucine--tRNA ligase n=1 Tax=Paraflavitalea devenefica TaxID=2716334 RepID=UPI00141D94E6|nr:leucine--tRNA ligase [Paraflavitalea devenefica]NII23776.1 leucine--tRNA ligase [Paraflavitalea devenefica]
MEYKFSQIEKKWQQIWKETNAYKVSNTSDRPKYYVLDMFPYPSGAGLHVGHPLGYIASDIFARYKRLKGFNVLHPMGYDAFGLPAEQYAIDHGIHPAVATDANINNFRRQLDNIGFCFDWDREIKTSDPSYYKWTQWIFLQLFHSWFNRKTKKAEPIAQLIKQFEKEGNVSHPCPGDSSIRFTEQLWVSFDERQQMDILMEYRLAYCGFGEVNWCEALGTVLANDEVVNGVSERGGFPVVRKKLRQWYLRITEYADRLLEGLEQVDFSDAMKEMQSNWIGKSYGAEITFAFKPANAPLATRHSPLTVYTTRPDTIFGVDFMVIAPEHELIDQITTPVQKQAVEDYIAYVKSRSERERMAEKKISGVFTGAYVLNPFDQREIPVWISEYVLAGYGTGAIMAVPCGDERDHKFANHFGISITNIIGSHYNGEEANPTKDAILENSGFLNGLVMRQAMEVASNKLEELGIGIRKVNYKMRDAAFSRQRYWGEPFPIAWKEGVAYPLSESELPVLLPHLDEIKPGQEGEGPLSNLPEWINSSPIGGQRESSTMPGYAGSSWYFLRYMDPHNDNTFCDRKASDYWGQVDLYIGGTEHAVGHLLYSRMWTKALYDLGYIGHDEPYKKLVNQGKIGGDSRLIYRLRGTNQFISAGLKDQYETDELHVDVSIVDGYVLDQEAFKQSRAEYETASFILEDGKYICGSRLEKMSKRYFNVVNPDDIVDKYGADTFRMYEMFLGPVEQDKPWDTKGIEGVHRFLKKLWRLFYDEMKGQVWNTAAPTDAELKVLHKAIKRAEEDTERFSFNTAVSSFMICVNDLSEMKCHKKDILQPLLILLTPYAPHVCEELWHLLGNDSAILDAAYPKFEPKYLVESNKEYPISVNGKLRTTINIALDAPQEDVEKIVLSNDVIQKWMEGKPHKKIIYVKGKMVNVVV